MPRPKRSTVKFERELERLFLVNGVSALTISDMATQLHCSRRHLYLFGNSKNDMFLHCIDNILSRIRDDGELAITKTSESIDKVAAYLQIGIRGTHSMSTAFMDDVNRIPQARAILDAHQHIRCQGLEKLIIDGIKLGSFIKVHPGFMAQAAFAVAQRICEPDMYKATGLTIEGGFAEMSKLLRSGLTHTSQEGQRQKQSHTQKAMPKPTPKPKPQPKSEKLL